MGLEEYRIPCWCPLCSSLMKGDSTYSFYDYGVCITCKIAFIDDREQRWKDGWRPSEEELEAYKAKYFPSLQSS